MVKTLVSYLFLGFAGLSALSGCASMPENTATGASDNDSDGGGRSY